MRLLGLEWAPWNVPLDRRIQTLSVLLYIFAYTFLGSFGALSVGLLLSLMFTPFFWLTWLYTVWYIYDFGQSSRGGRRFKFLGQLPQWRWFRDYFPMRLITTSQLDPEHSYVIGSHPHGLNNIGIATNIASDVNGMSEHFPGIKSHFLIMKFFFYVPLAREFMMAFGTCDVSRTSINYLLKKKGNAVVIIVGGAREMIDARPGLARLVLKSRKGFVRVAIENGAHLVPSFTFGENELYRQAFDNSPGSTLRAFQRWCQAKTSAVPPVAFYGRGVFNYSLGPLPHRVPLVTVVGKAIPVEQNASPSPEYVDRIHAQYLNDLKALFDDHKVGCGYPNLKIEFID